ncbi:MAG TPA: DUF4416 family protein [Desulfomonilaceae bacterium]|nr:DUF4416 family protein [Desulfomonilaceae bacterium]
MSLPKIPEPAKLVISALSAREDLLKPVSKLLVEDLGPIEEEIGPIPFNYTKYYDREMGPGICRSLWSFAQLVDRGSLVRIKLLTNRIEQSYTTDGKRRFNLDPALMSLGNFVLATGKDNAHRIYLGEGIFADLTLIFRAGTYRSLEWTYPDYADPVLIGILNRIRENYKCGLKGSTTITHQ